MRKIKGFTLLEVMIALTIFALIATTLSQAASITVDNQIHIERKLLATWIAENQIIELRSVSFNNITTGKKELEFADRQWIVETLVAVKKKFSGMSLPLDVKSLTVSVSLKESPDNPLQTLTAYVAND